MAVPGVSQARIVHGRRVSRARGIIAIFQRIQARRLVEKVLARKELLRAQDTREVLAL